MSIDFENNEKPIFLQLAEILEDNILKGVFCALSQIPSIAEISAFYKINPATANKSVSILAEEGLLHKRRGIGMFVDENAKEKILSKRMHQFTKSFISPMLEEAQKLGIEKQDIIQLINKN